MTTANPILDPEHLAAAILVTSRELKATRDAFETHQIGRGFPERFVTWFYAQAIATVLGGGHVAPEISVPKTSKTHLDMLVFNDEIAVLGENKRDGSAGDIKDDVARLHRFAGDISARFRDGRRRSLYAFIGFDCYVSTQAASWCQGILVPAVSTFTRRSTTVFLRDQLPAEQWVGAKSNEDGYYLCWALKQINLEPQA